MQTEIALGLQACLRVGRLMDEGQARARDGLADQAQQLRQGARHRARGARHARRQRHLRRVPRDPPRDEPRGGQHLRGHARHPRADPRPRADRASRRSPAEPPMLEDARAVADGAVLECDLAIVGAGAAGIALALEFADGPRRVCLLEAGGLEIDGATQELYQGENVGLPYFDLRSAACASSAAPPTIGPATASRSMPTRSSSRPGSRTAAGRSAGRSSRRTTRAPIGCSASPGTAGMSPTGSSGGARSACRWMIAGWRVTSS